MFDKKDFYFELPPELIAQYPAEQRSASRLLSLDKGSGDIQHKVFKDFPSLVNPGDLLVFNNTRVVPARLFGEKETGGKVEVLIERVAGVSRAIAQIRASKAPQPESIILLSEGLSIKVVNKIDDMYLIESTCEASISMIMQAVGHMPLPPYIDRLDEDTDFERYQTVYSQRDGAVAAPTAGLHFDKSILEALNNKGVDFAYCTLHVGAGTFQPVRTDDIREHKMHAEYVEVDAQLCNQVREAKAKGNRVIAIGTTAVRSLETASLGENWIEPYFGDTEIFIYPGYNFKTVDSMLTNFHLPESTLLMLISAFADKEKVLNAYNEAIKERYRFFSYGDAMFIH